MLSYRHAFHAGNTADVLKHWVLLSLLDALQSKPAGFTYIDTHAGAGAYELLSPMAEKTNEWQHGIGRHYPKTMVDHPLIEALTNSVEAYDGGLRYPGSALLAASRLRSQDQAINFELHSTDYALLQGHLKHYRSTRAYQEDGLAGLLSKLPTPSRRALVLIDPSYEIKSDYERIPTVIHQALTRMSNCVIALWYPIVSRDQSTQLIQQCVKHLSQRTHVIELGEKADTEGFGMTASGMLVINSPWNLLEQLTPTLQALASLHSQDGKLHWRAESLIDK